MGLAPFRRVELGVPEQGVTANNHVSAICDGSYVTAGLDVILPTVNLSTLCAMEWPLFRVASLVPQ
jgi:hypothetical protein